LQSPEEVNNELKLPRAFRDNIERTFGERGRNWLERLPQLLSCAVEGWQLQNLSLADNLSFNYVAFADSPTYGEVVLKIGVPHRELFTEMEALQLYTGEYSCRCCESDKELGALLLERIRPGGDLTCVEGRPQRIAAAEELITQLWRSVPQSHSLPSYDEWFKRAFSMVRQAPVVDQRFSALIEHAQTMWHSLQELDRPQVVLHGDLHHMNMLRSGTTSWKAIDPKGVTGMLLLEIAPFIENELRLFPPTNRQKALDEMLAAFACRTDEHENILAQSLFVVEALRMSWRLEECGEPDWDQLVGNLELFLECVQARSDAPTESL
jgi:streptomycin 6-kinase